MRIEDRIRDDGLLTLDDVEARLVDAICYLWRMPDRERAWLRLRAHWPDVLRHTWFGDYGDTDSDAPAPRVPETRAQDAATEQALGWLDVVDPADRKLIGLVLRRKAADRPVRWIDLLGPMGVAHGADGLRKRYGRAMAVVVKRVNATR